MKTLMQLGWLFIVGDETHELGYTNMFTDMFNAIEEGREANETFYDGYVVNAVIDAAYKSAKTKLWEPINLQIGVTKPSVYQEFDTDHWFIKDEILPNGDVKVLLKKKISCEIVQIERLNNG